jgi:hypothetical protein
MFETFFLLGTATLTLSGVRPFGLGIALSDLLYFAALAALIFERSARQMTIHEWVPGHPFWVTAVLILAGGLFATLESSNPVSNIIMTLKSCFLFSAWISMGIVIVIQRKQAGRVIGALVIGALISSVVAILDSLTGATLGPTIYGLNDVTISGVDLPVLASVYGRYGGTIGHPNIQSEFTVVVIPLVLDMVFSAWQAAKRLKSITLLVIVSLFVYANLLTGSFSGAIGVLLSFVLVSGIRLFDKLSRYFVLLIVITAGIGLIFLLASADLPVSPLQELSDQLAGDANVDRALNTTGPGRLDLMGDTLLAISRNPVSGYGMDLLAIESADIGETGVHNAILRSWITGGIFAFIGIAYAYWQSLRLSMGMIARYLRGNRAPYIVGLAVSTIVWMVNDMAQPSFYQRFTWLIVAILYGLLLGCLQTPIENPENRVNSEA